jgi:hypothetical protein
MTTTTRLMLALSICGCLCSVVAQESQLPAKTGRYIVMTRDSAGNPVYKSYNEKPPVSFNPSFDTAKVKRNWSKLKKGLNEQEVQQLLGSSRAVETDWENALNYWWYGRRAVVFNSFSKKVSYWDK